jgi:hypothetical protein
MPRMGVTSHGRSRFQKSGSRDDVGRVVGFVIQSPPANVGPGGGADVFSVPTAVSQLEEELEEAQLAQCGLECRYRVIAA